MKRYLAKRLLYALLILFLVSVLIFSIARLLPGDPIQAAAMMNMDLANEEIINDLLLLAKPQISTFEELDIQKVLDNYLEI